MELHVLDRGIGLRGAVWLGNADGEVVEHKGFNEIVAPF